MSIVNGRGHSCKVTASTFLKMYLVTKLSLRVSQNEKLWQTIVCGNH